MVHYNMFFNKFNTPSLQHFHIFRQQWDIRVSIYSSTYIQRYISLSPSHTYTDFLFKIYTKTIIVDLLYMSFYMFEKETEMTETIKVCRSKTIIWLNNCVSTSPIYHKAKSITRTVPVLKHYHSTDITAHPGEFS